MPRAEIFYDVVLWFIVCFTVRGEKTELVSGEFGAASGNVIYVG